ncbi:Leucine-rich repeat (LRR) protein [Dyadobacter sp. BE34]|uniref:Leucine-rich repeat (LRR) protein n=1 Tax=Dyadobacter fermentans TaxID=94254 RepID=A0ABU1QR10_9BACT|nr:MULTISPECIES: T9SS type A sorting domain-containing protein [Dyadobacter]MDR6803580.1 Leucine-rich repeat (LRR) protein [Dyadobacter fermentans]MDR7041320.1 Leucine-rich repeat (LRR) protein [Dyadobacter sp. BE242]MDR7195724.1 Leucine-rich repeat (LRR) protein [Dyadobacter sp. BE34]MDR7213732.1 Leucine-rich repeat (LRR) protein [Dyadobacter sp. BE31]MDR7261130.1 Leucine-rich repeat (LRR) protein [Dyadobacter sp. BE32]
MRKFLLFLLFISFKSFAQSLESDRLALVAIYNATSTGVNEVYGEPNFNDITGWNIPGVPGDSPCGWPGVTCEGGRVTRLDLSQNQVFGPIAPEIGNLTELKYLNLEGGGGEMNPWTGELPLTLGNLTKLEYLNLSHNRISITNMGVIGNLTGLKQLAVTPLGEIPSQWASLVNLEVLFLGSNEAFPPGESFTFPVFLTGFTKLRELYLMGQLAGALPSQIGGIPNLEILEIVRNYNLTGQIPAAIGNLSKLKQLTIRRSFDGGPIPVEIGNLVNLEGLRISDIPLTGSIPAQINNLTKLVLIDIGSTNLGGPLPPINNLTALTVLDIRYNKFKGPLPSLANIPVSGYVNVGSNAFTFAGLEENFSKLDGYLIQAKIPMLAQFAPGGAKLSVQAGGTLANNTYKWFKNNVLFATTVGDNSLIVTEEAMYRVEITNSVVTGLKLVSNNYDYVKLPVALVSFAGKSESNQTKLTWKTTSETDNKGFEIERSADARSFAKIGFVDGNGDTKEINTYHFTDVSPLVRGFYRLKQLDYDGKFEYSKIIEVKGDGAIVKVYPNPAEDYLTISGISQKQPFSIVDRNGRVVLKGFVKEKDQIDVRRLGAGSYVVKVGEFAGKLFISR